MPSDIEEEILAIERELYTIPDLHALRRRLAGLEQTLMQNWTGAGFPTAAPAPPGVSDFPDICPNIPTTLRVIDQLTGGYNITYDKPSMSWIGCKIYARPASATPCPAMNIPVWFQLYGQDDSTNWDMYIRWFAPNNGNVCPTQGKTCADNIFGTGALFRSTICGTTCAEGNIFGTTGAMDWVNQNQVGLAGTTSIFRVQ